jgi:hypothetical protein
MLLLDQEVMSLSPLDYSNHVPTRSRIDERLATESRGRKAHNGDPKYFTEGGKRYKDSAKTCNSSSNLKFRI